MPNESGAIFIPKVQSLLSYPHRVNNHLSVQLFTPSIQLDKVNTSFKAKANKQRKPLIFKYKT